MSGSRELRKIKKAYGENFMKLCRKMFPTILEQEGMLYEILLSSFSRNSKTLYEDITSAGLEDEFRTYIYSKVNMKNPEKRIITGKTPYELLKEAGYTLTECHTEEEIQEFIKYYAPGEELCTFDGGRLEKCFVFWAVKDGAENLNRKDFKNPERQDEYGTSVIGIQFNKKGACTVSIKNRYNDIVKNADATFGNDLEKIIPGLEDSFRKLLAERGYKLNVFNKELFNMKGYIVADDGRYYKYNRIINGIYYCPGNIIVDNGKAIKIGDSEKKILMDYFILDLENKTIELYDKSIKDCFQETFSEIEKIEVIRNKEDLTRKIIITQKGKKEPVIIELDKDNRIIGYINNEIEEIGDYFLEYATNLAKIGLRNAKKIGNSFCLRNKELKEFNLPNAEEIGNSFVLVNKKINKMNMPKVKKIGTFFMMNNEDLEVFDAPCVEIIKNDCLTGNRKIKVMNMPIVKEIGDGFLAYNENITVVDLQNLEKLGERFMFENNSVKIVNMPKGKFIGKRCFEDNETLVEFNFNGEFEEDADRKRINDIINKNRRKIGVREIAELEKETKLTTSETIEGQEIIEGISKEKVKNKDGTKAKNKDDIDIV